MMHPGAGMGMGMGMAMTPNQSMMAMGMNMGMPQGGMTMGMPCAMGMNPAMVQQPKHDAFADFGNFGKWWSWRAKIVRRSSVGFFLSISPSLSLSLSPSIGEGLLWAANKEYLNNVNYYNTNTLQSPSFESNAA